MSNVILEFIDKVEYDHFSLKFSFIIFHVMFLFKDGTQLHGNLG